MLWCYVCASYTLYRKSGSLGGVYQVYDTTEHCHHIKQVIRTYNIVYNSTSSEFVRIFNPQRRKTNNFFEQILSFQNPKITQFWIQSKQQNGGTRNKHCNLLIYTVPLNRILIEHCYYNIQAIKYQNNADLMFLQRIFRRHQRWLL